VGGVPTEAHAVAMADILTDPFPSDEDLHELCLNAWGNPGPSSFKPILSRSLAHIGAFEDGRLIGFVNVAWDGGVHAFILDTCVNIDFRRRGIATRMVMQAREVARARGAQWLHVDFEPHLRGFYRKCGFVDTNAGLIRLE
jgi:ribosomal protein S18 acetylase RimI-like enzyme